MNSAPLPDRWSARGLLFENCNCTIVCPGHVHFDQKCTFERCVGYWALDFRDGEFGGVPLAGVRAVIAYDSPQRMIDGGWTQAIIIDEGADPDQRAPVEAILTGRAGGPWAVLSRFVAAALETRFMSIRIDDDGRKKRVRIAGLLDGQIEAIRGRDREQTVTFENMFNQIHATSQVIARGRTAYDDGSIKVETEGTHGLYSEFDWTVTPQAES